MADDTTVTPVEPDTERADILDGIEGFEIGDSGYLEPVFKEGAEETPASPTETPVVETVAPPPVPEAPQVDWEKRYKDLQSEFTRRSQELADLRRKQEAASSPAAPSSQEPAELSEDEFLELSSDPKRFSAYVAQQVDARVKAMLQPHAAALEDIGYQRELRTVMQQNPDFVEKLPFIRQVVEKLPDVSFQEAYDIASTFLTARESGQEGKAPESGEATATATPPPPAEEPTPKRVPLAQLAAKAAVHQQESRISPAQGDKQKRTVSNSREAFTLALEQVLEE